MFSFFSPLINKKLPTARLFGARDVPLQEHQKRRSPLAPATRSDRDCPWLSCPISLSRQETQGCTTSSPCSAHLFCNAKPAMGTSAASPPGSACSRASSAAQDPHSASAPRLPAWQQWARLLHGSQCGRHCCQSHGKDARKDPSGRFSDASASVSLRGGSPMEIKPSGWSPQKASSLHEERDLIPCLKEPLCAVIKCRSNR